MLPFSRYTVPMLALAAGAIAVSLHLGCNNRKVPAASGSTIVKGRVTFQGEPVAGAMVVFAPDRERGLTGKPVRAETGPDGVFELKGEVQAGWHRVAVAPAAEAALDRFPPQLRRPDTSGISREVQLGKENAFELAVSMPQ